MNPDLRVRYLGFDLKSPLVASAGPVTGTIEGLQRVEAAGVGAVVLPSLFEEQIVHEELALHRLQEFGTESNPEALDFFPGLATYNTGPESYLELVRTAVKELSIPVIASLNGSSDGGWVEYARLIEEAGASALELNIYFVPTNPDFTGGEVENRYLKLFTSVREAVVLPLAVKVGPSFSAPANMARRLADAGADGLVLFNRFLRPDIDLEQLKLEPSLVLSKLYASRLPLQWIAILYGRIKASLAATGGVHEASDAIKLLLAGSDVVMTTSALLQRGPDHARTLLDGISNWMQEHEYESVRQMTGSMSYSNCPDPSGYERANYMKALVSYSEEL